MPPFLMYPPYDILLCIPGQRLSTPLSLAKNIHIQVIKLIKLRRPTIKPHSSKVVTQVPLVISQVTVQSKATPPRRSKVPISVHLAANVTRGHAAEAILEDMRLASTAELRVRVRQASAPVLARQRLEPVSYRQRLRPSRVVFPRRGIQLVDLLDQAVRLADLRERVDCSMARSLRRQRDLQPPLAARLDVGLFCAPRDAVPPRRSPAAGVVHEVVVGVDQEVRNAAVWPVGPVVEVGLGHLWRARGEGGAAAARTIRV